MVKMVPPSRGLRRIDVESSVGTKTVDADRGGLFEVSHGATIRKLQEEGFTIASAGGVVKGINHLGYDCSKCGFSGWFAICGRCGHNNKE